MVCEASFAGYSYVNLLCYSLLSVSKAFSSIVSFTKKIPLKQSNTYLIFFGRSLLLFVKVAILPKKKKKLFKDANVLHVVKLFYFGKVHFQLHRCFYYMKIKLDHFSQYYLNYTWLVKNHFLFLFLFYIITLRKLMAFKH